MAFGQNNDYPSHFLPTNTISAQRTGLLFKIVHLMPPFRLKLFCNGLFSSKLFVFGNVWDIPNNDETSRRLSAFTKEDNKKLYRFSKTRFEIENQPSTSSAVLLQKSNDLSVQQLTAYTSLLIAQKSIDHKEPVYL